MNEDLHALASLEFGRAMNALSEQKTERLRAALSECAARGMARSGVATAKTQEIEIEFAHKACKALSDIWVGLLEGTNGGTLTREHVNFIKAQVAGVAGARKGSLMNPRPSPMNSPNQTAIARNVAMAIDRIESQVINDLEIRLRRQKFGLPTGEQMREGMNVTIQNAANVNLGSQIGTINSALNVISEQNQESGELATAIRGLSEAIGKSAEMKDDQKREALQVIADLVRQAELKPEERSKGTIRALVEGLPSVFGLTADVTTLWLVYVPAIRAFFGI